MFWNVMTRVLLAAALVVTIHTAATAQEQAAVPEGMKWYLTAYDAGGAELTDVPWNLGATLTLNAGRAAGFAGCNWFEASYELDGDAISFGPSGTNAVGCPDRLLKVETAYMEALPKAARVAADTGGPSLDLYLFDADDEQLLRFTSSESALLVRQIQDLTVEVKRQELIIKNLRARIKELEQSS